MTDQRLDLSVVTDQRLDLSVVTDQRLDLSVQVITVDVVMPMSHSFDAEKFREVVMYTLSRCPSDRVGAVKLHKVLYFSDMLAFAQLKQPITGATYRKRPYGPTTDRLLLVLRQLETTGDIIVRKQDYFGYQKTVFDVMTPVVETNRLSTAERAIIDEMIDFVCFKNSARTISDLSHTRAWELAELGEEIPYHSVFQLFPQEISLDAMRWGADEAPLIEDERSTTDPMDYVSFASFRGRLQARKA